MDEKLLPVGFEEKLSTVHDALNEAAQESQEEGDSTVASFRISTKLKEAADVICKANGTDLSKFLRKCVKRLVQDYCPGQEKKE